MKKIRNLIIGFVFGLIIGLGLGVNIGRDKPILSTPFGGSSLQNKLKKTGDEIIKKGGEVLEESGKALQEKSNKR
jgi:hypothetical protein